jgi:hypothetical protein
MMPNRPTVGLSGWRVIPKAFAADLAAFPRNHHFAPRLASPLQARLGALLLPLSITIVLETPEPSDSLSLAARMSDRDQHWG